MTDVKGGIIVETVLSGSLGSVYSASSSIHSAGSVRASALSSRRREPSEPFPGAFGSLLSAGGGGRHPEINPREFDAI